jgi:hypothetical protein
MNEIRSLLGVNWFDGLLVSSAHLSHADERVQAYFTSMAHTTMDQPGLVGGREGSATSHQLVEIASQSKADGLINISLNLTRAFQTVTPGGTLTVGIPNTDKRAGVPTTSIPATLKEVHSGDFLICVRQRLNESLTIRSDRSNGHNIQLSYPDLELALTPPAEYSQKITSEFESFAPIGLLSAIDGQLVVDTEYIPPLSRLDLAGSFDSGLVPSVKQLLHDLSRTVAELVRSGVAATAEGKVGVDFMTRQAEYEALNAFLLSKIGTIHHMDRMSPFGLLREVVYPVASWWQLHYARNFQQSAADHSSVKKLLGLANRLTAISYSDVCAGSQETLRQTRAFTESLCAELGIVA